MGFATTIDDTSRRLIADDALDTQNLSSDEHHLSSCFYDDIKQPIDAFQALQIEDLFSPLR